MTDKYLNLNIENPIGVTNFIIDDNSVNDNIVYFFPSENISQLSLIELYEIIKSLAAKPFLPET